MKHVIICIFYMADQPADKGILFESALQNRWEKAVSTLGININDLHGVGGHA